MALFEKRPAWLHCRYVAHGKLRARSRVAFVAVVACAPVVLDTACVRPKRAFEPVVRELPVNWRDPKAARAALQNAIQPVRLGMTESELRRACRVENGGEPGLWLRTTPSRMDPALDVKTNSGVDVRVAVDKKTRRTKLVLIYSPSFVVYDRIHVGSTYAEVVACLNELGVNFSQPCFNGELVFAAPGLEFYFARPEGEPTSLTTEANASGDAWLAELATDVAGGETRQVRPAELAQDARVTAIGLREIPGTALNYDSSDGASGGVRVGDLE